MDLDISIFFYIIKSYLILFYRYFLRFIVIIKKTNIPIRTKIFIPI